MTNVFLMEDHDEALKIWRKRDIRGLDLIHLDAHIDFGFHEARPIDKIVNEAGSVKELKEKLEYSLSFLHYEKDLNKQTDIGNYIYPAIEEGIVRNFYWIVPGGLKEFNDSKKVIKDILKDVIKRQGNKKITLEGGRNGVISADCLGRNFTICTLDNLPFFAKDIILDIDTDFLVIDSVLNADNTKNIGRRRLWISPEELAKTLKEKINNPRITTISYSVNGGWTPMGYRYLGDELACHFEPLRFSGRFKTSRRAAQHFNLFNSTGKKEHYQRAVELDPAYRLIDNNLGPLYLLLRRFSRAEEEFERILRVDRQNPASLFGLGVIALERKEFFNAKRCFHSASRHIGNNRLFATTKKHILFELGRAEFCLKNFKRAKELLLAYKNIFPLEPQSYYLLGRVLEKEKNFLEAAIFYKDAVRLGFGGTEPLFRLLKISSHLEDGYAIIKYVTVRYRDFKKEFARFKKPNLGGKRTEASAGFEKKILSLEKRLRACRINLKGGERDE